MLISCAVSGLLICTFVLAYTKCRFSHDMAQLLNIIFRELEHETAFLVDCPFLGMGDNRELFLSSIPDIQGQIFLLKGNFYS